MYKNVLPLALALLSAGLPLVDARTISSGSRTSKGKSLAKGAVIAIIVVIIVAVIVLAICVFCACRIMKGRKAKNAGATVEAPVVADKPYETQNYGQPPYGDSGNNYGGGAGPYGPSGGYGAPPPAGGYEHQQASYGAPAGGYEHQQASYGAPAGGYGQPAYNGPDTTGYQGYNQGNQSYPPPPGAPVHNNY